ncbi:MAG: CsbD family protein [Actinophytocola sp.]|nr:CsbD family protein [Actinophytocola sp.]
MSIFRRAKHAAEQVVGGIKEKAGFETGKPGLEGRGRARKATGKAKSAGHTAARKAKRVDRRSKP